jgi:hypothetical protein
MAGNRTLQAEYIADMCEQLAEMARDIEFPIVAYLLGMAARALRA